MATGLLAHLVAAVRLHGGNRAALLGTLYSFGVAIASFPRDLFHLLPILGSRPLCISCACTQPASMPLNLTEELELIEAAIKRTLEAQASTATSEEGFKQEKLGPGLIYECAPGEDAKAIAAQRPNSEFDPFILRCLMFICRPMCLPRMLATLDYSGATFMNARIAYQEAWDNWKDEQKLVIKPLVSRIWRWKVEQWIARGDLSPRDDAFAHEVVCKRWPYVGPYKEAMAEKVDPENGTNTRTAICARSGRDYRDMVRERIRELTIERQEGLAADGSEKTQEGKDSGDATDGD